jgi:hypothetical protein
MQCLYDYFCFIGTRLTVNNAIQIIMPYHNYQVFIDITDVKLIVMLVMMIIIRQTDDLCINCLVVNIHNSFILRCLYCYDYS